MPDGEGGEDGERKRRRNKEDEDEDEDKEGKLSRGKYEGEAMVMMKLR